MIETNGELDYYHLMRYLLLFAVSSCTLSSVTPSVHRDAEPVCLEVDGVSVCPTGAINLYVFAMLDHVDFFPASFHIRGAGRDIYIDPVAVDATTPADVIFVTHGHMDHLSVPDLRKLLGPETLIVCPREVADELEGLPHRVAAPGQVGEEAGVRFETTAAYNTRSAFLGLKAHPPSDENVGYVIEVEGVRFFFPGDTDMLPEMKALEEIDVALVPIAGGDVAMSTEQAAEVANALHPRIAVPTHYPLVDSEVERFRELVDSEIEVQVLQRTRASTAASR